MIIYKDIITNDELFTDSNRMKVVDDCLYKVLCTFVTRKEGEIVLAGANPSADAEDLGDGGTDEKVQAGLDLVLNQCLVETQFSKDDYKKYLKTYTKALLDKWTSMGVSGAQLDEYKEKFTKAATHIVKLLGTKPQFYLGESCNADGMVAVLSYEDNEKGEEEAYMYFFKHGLEEEKC